MVSQILLKTFYEVLILPVTCRVVKVLKAREGIDTYDTGISYNIFKVKDL